MSVESKQHDTYQMIRLESDMVMESDADAVKNAVEQALRAGVKRFVLSVSIGPMANRMVISRLLLWCKQTIMHQKAQLLFVEKKQGGESVFGTLCESLHIPMCQDCETAVVVADESKKDP